MEGKELTVLFVVVLFGYVLASKSTSTSLPVTQNSTDLDDVTISSTRVASTSPVAVTTLTTPKSDACRQDTKRNVTGSWIPDASSIFNLMNSPTENSVTGLDRRSLGIVIFGYVCFLCIVVLVGVIGVLHIVCRQDRRHRKRLQRRQGYQAFE